MIPILAIVAVFGEIVVVCGVISICAPSVALCDGDRRSGCNVKRLRCKFRW